MKSQVHAKASTFHLMLEHKHWPVRSIWSFTKTSEFKSRSGGECVFSMVFFFSWAYCVNFTHFMLSSWCNPFDFHHLFHLNLAAGCTPLFVSLYRDTSCWNCSVQLATIIGSVILLKGLVVAVHTKDFDVKGGLSKSVIRMWKSAEERTFQCHSG